MKLGSERPAGGDPLCWESIVLGISESTCRAVSPISGTVALARATESAPRHNGSRIQPAAMLEGAVGRLSLY
jgi:hypothetical protein